MMTIGGMSSFLKKRRIMKFCAAGKCWEHGRLAGIGNDRNANDPLRAGPGAFIPTPAS
jgi:hypothetical protein